MLWCRWFCARILLYKHFENFILLIIGLSSICLAMDEPVLDPDSKLKQVRWAMAWLGPCAMDSPCKQLSSYFNPVLKSYSILLTQTRIGLLCLDVYYKQLKLVLYAASSIRLFSYLLQQYTAVIV